VEFRPDEVGLDVTPGRWKRACQKALAAEGVGIGQWQTMPVPAQDVFQAGGGYGKGGPWNCRHARPGITYDAAEYPRTVSFIDGHSYLSGVYPPNDMELMQRYVEAFAKVSANAERVVALAN